MGYKIFKINSNLLLGAEIYRYKLSECNDEPLSKYRIERLAGQIYLLLQNNLVFNVTAIQTE
jgi:hypothetical protein